MENVVSITHATDIDGVGSAALLKMRYGMPSRNIFFADYKLENLEQVEKGVRKVLKDGTLLFLADLGVNEKTSVVFMRIVREVKRRHGKVFWFDHHPWDGSNAKRLAEMCDVAIFGENRRYCGAEITRKELGLKDRFTEDFCRIVHYSDFNIRPKRRSEYETVGNYALSIAYYHMHGMGRNMRELKHMVEVIAGGRLLDRRIISDAKRYKRLNDRQLARMLKGDVYIGNTMALGFAGHIQKTYACMKLIEKTGKDIGIYVNTVDGRGHIRSINSDITALAVRFGGGGHVHAAGFTPDFKKYNGFRTRKDKERLLWDMEGAAERLVPRKAARNASSRKAMFT